MLRTAVILAGGKGTRLQSVITDVPKPLAPVNGHPFLDYQLRYLKHFGIQNVILSTGYLSDKIKQQYGDEFMGMQIEYSVETEPMGTGGGIRLALQHCIESHSFVLNGDSFFDIDLEKFYTDHRNGRSMISIALRNVENASRYGTIERNEKDRIISFKEKDPHVKKGTINAGVYLLDRGIYHQHTPAGRGFSIEKEFFEKKLNEITIKGFLFEGYFIDIGIPEDLEKAQHDFKGFKY